MARDVACASGRSRHRHNQPIPSKGRWDYLGAPARSWFKRACTLAPSGNSSGGPQYSSFRGGSSHTLAAAPSALLQPPPEKPSEITSLTADRGAAPPPALPAHIGQH